VLGEEDEETVVAVEVVVVSKEVVLTPPTLTLVEVLLDTFQSGQSTQSVQFPVPLYAGIVGYPATELVEVVVLVVVVATEVVVAALMLRLVLVVVVVQSSHNDSLSCGQLSETVGRPE
jgi:hypothetical protein